MGVSPVYSENMGIPRGEGSCSQAALRLSPSQVQFPLFAPGWREVLQLHVHDYVVVDTDVQFSSPMLLVRN